MRGVIIGIFVMVLLVPIVIADPHMTRDDVSLDSVQCGEYGLLHRGQWNGCFVHIGTKRDLESVTLTAKIIETGYEQTTPWFNVKRRDYAKKFDAKRGFDIAVTRLVDFYIPGNHPTGQFTLELSLGASATRAFKTFRAIPFTIAVYRPVQVQ